MAIELEEAGGPSRGGQQADPRDRRRDALEGDPLAIGRPAGEVVSVLGLASVSWRSWLPSAFITQRAGLPERYDVNARRVPSGDQAGVTSGEIRGSPAWRGVRFRRFARLRPTTSATKMSPSGSSSCEWKARRRPSGDQAPSRSGGVPSGESGTAGRVRSSISMSRVGTRSVGRLAKTMARPSGRALGRVPAYPMPSTCGAPPSGLAR